QQKGTDGASGQQLAKIKNNQTAADQTYQGEKVAVGSVFHQSNTEHEPGEPGGGDSHENGSEQVMAGSGLQHGAAEGRPGQYESVAQNIEEPENNRHLL